VVVKVKCYQCFDLWDHLHGPAQGLWFDVMQHCWIWQHALSCFVFWVWCLCAYGVDFNSTLDPGFSLLDLIFLSQAPNREQMVLCNLLPTYFRPIPPFYSPLLQQFPQGVGVLKSGSLAPGCFSCSEQNGWTAARACFLSGNMVERLWPAETWPEAMCRSTQPCASHFISEWDTVLDILWLLLGIRCLLFLFAVFFFPSLSLLARKSKFCPFYWGFFFPSMLISLVPFQRGGLKPSTQMHRSTHTRTC